MVYLKIVWLMLFYVPLCVREIYLILLYCLKKTQELQSYCKIEATEDHNCKINYQIFWYSNMKS